MLFLSLFYNEQNVFADLQLLEPASLYCSFIQD